MLEKVHIENFKSLGNISLDFKKFNVLIGLNSTGKTSVLQALAFLKQNVGRRSIAYDASLVRLGSFTDVVYKHNVDLSVKTQLTFLRKKKNVSYCVKLSQRGALEELVVNGNRDWWIGEPYNIIHLPSPGTGQFTSIESHQKFAADQGSFLESWFRSMLYLPMVRGFTNYGYPLSDTAPSLRDVFHHSGTLSSLETHLSNLIQGIDSKSKKDLSYKRQLDKISLRLSRLGVSLEPTVAERHRVIPGLREGDLWLSAVNSGFGTNQIIQVIILGSLADIGTLIMIEEPEIHLHPAMQREVTSILVDIANEGKQILITTHSEHMLLNARRLVLEGKLSSGDVKIYYFEKVKGETKVSEVKITEEGVFEGGLPGFLDYEIEELNALLKLRKKGQ